MDKEISVDYNGYQPIERGKPFPIQGNKRVLALQETEHEEKGQAPGRYTGEFNANA